MNRVRRSETAATVQRDATNPRVDGPAVLPLFCLAPHGVFLASRITPRAVSSYLAFSPLPVPLLPKNRRCLFCDTFRHRNPAVAGPRRPRLLRGMLPYGVRTFLQQAAKAAHQRSSAIGAESSTESKIWKPGNRASIRRLRRFSKSLDRGRYGFCASCVRARDCSVTSRARSSARFM